MADKYDDLAKSLGIPPAMMPWWRKTAGASAPPAPPTPPAPLRPGDPGWSVAGAAAAPGGTVGLPEPPPGPRPGESGFSVFRPGVGDTSKPSPTAETPIARPSSKAESKPGKPASLADLARESNASIENVVGERKGVPVADLTGLSPKKTAALLASQRSVVDTAKSTTGEDKKRLAEATFSDEPGATSGGAPVMVSPGGRTPHSWSTQTQEGVKLSPDTKAAAEGAENSAFTAADLHAQADERAAAGELAILRRHELVQQARETELRDRADRQRQQYETSLAKLNDMTQAVQSDRIDPEQWFKTRSNAQLFAAGIGVALGAFGQGLRGGGANPGLELVNNAIGSEIDAQKSNARLRREKLEDQRSLLGQMARTYGDERVAEDAAWVLYLEKAKTQLAAQMAEAKTDFAKAKYADAITQVKEQIASRREKWDQLEQDRVTRVQHDVNAPPTFAGGAAGGPLDKGDREDIRETAKELVKANVPQQLATLQQIDRTIDTFGSGAIPGVGPIASQIPDVAYGIVGSERAVAARQAFQAVKLQIQHEIAGASLTGSEKAELNVLTKGAYDAGSLRRVVDLYRAKLSGTAKTIGTIGSDRARAEMSRRARAIETEKGAPYNVPRSAPAAPYVKPPE